MSRIEDAINLANKRKVVSVHQMCLIEGINITLYDVDMCLKGMEPAHIAKHYVRAVISMERAYDFILNNLNHDNSIALLYKLFKISTGSEVAHDSYDISINEEFLDKDVWKCGIPVTDFLIEDLEKLDKFTDPESKAVSYFCYTISKQLFIEANERVAYLVANKILINAGVGVLSIDEHNVDEFRVKYAQWLKTAHAYDIYWFIKNQCIERI